MMVKVSISPRPVAAAGSPSDNPSVGTYGRVTSWLSKRVELTLAQMELTLPQYRVLGILAEGSADASGLAGRLAVRPSSVTAIIDGLVARGLVDRRHEECDRRRIALRLTDEGARTVAAADSSVDESLASMAALLPPEDEIMVLRSLELWGRALAASHPVRAAQ